MLGPFGEVAMLPDVVESGEIGVLVFAAVWVVPKADRHGGERPGAHELPFAAPHRLAVLGEDVHRIAQPRPLDLAAPYRAGRVAEHEAAANVGAARDRGEMQVAL